MGKRLTLVLGGVRAGKSTYAQKLAASGNRVLFVATAEAGDEDMEGRINAHRESRSADWDTLEEPIYLVSALTPLLPRYDTILLDCLTLWVSNLMLADSATASTHCDIPAATRGLLELYRSGEASWVIVSNEVGLGVVPPTKLGRKYADELGHVNQLVAAEADNVYFMAAGIPMAVKSSAL